MTDESEHDEREALIEAAAGAWRARAPDGSVQTHPAWHDLDADGRCDAFEVARQMRRLEAAADPAGLSTTAKAVLARIQKRAR
ncbi:MAG: hypothetical protein FWD73_06430 [Polyangiaceae bacterium]|nr:hypothetical protein [Polyangiaceae bacterium]